MTLVYPMAATVFYIFLIGVYNFAIRKNAIVKGTVKPAYFKALDAAAFPPPERVAIVGRHYNNLLELPPLFLITCLVGLHFGMSDLSIIAPAWGFLFTRMIHTFFHLGSNKIIPRALAFGMGWVMILSMWVIILNHMRIYQSA